MPFESRDSWGCPASAATCWRHHRRTDRLLNNSSRLHARPAGRPFSVWLIQTSCRTSSLRCHRRPCGWLSGVGRDQSFWSSPSRAGLGHRSAQLSRGTSRMRSPGSRARGIRSLQDWLVSSGNRSWSSRPQLQLEKPGPRPTASNWPRRGGTSLVWSSTLDLSPVRKARQLCGLRRMADGRSRDQGSTPPSGLPV